MNSCSNISKDLLPFFNKRSQRPTNFNFSINYKDCGKGVTCSHKELFGICAYFHPLPSKEILSVYKLGSYLPLESFVGGMLHLCSLVISPGISMFIDIKFKKHKITTRTGLVFFQLLLAHRSWTRTIPNMKYFSHCLFFLIFWDIFQSKDICSSFPKTS